MRLPVTSRRLAIRGSLAASLLVSLSASLVGPAQAGPTAPRSPAPASAWPVVRGLGGQSSLLLDRGRDLRGLPLRRARATPCRRAQRSSLGLNAVEKARLDARRIGLASGLNLDQKLQRLVAIARHRLPVDPASEQRYAELSAKEEQRHGLARLSAHVQAKSGVCRERAFLLAMLLDEAQLPGRVRYGLLYGREGHFLEEHAWVESGRGRQRILLDPSVPVAVPAARTTLREEALPDGTVRRVMARETADLLYLPTSDLSYLPRSQ